MAHALFRYSDAVIFNHDYEARLPRFGSDREFAAAEFGRQSVLQRIFNNGLQEHAWNERVERVFVNLFVNLKIVASESRNLDVEIIVDEVEFLLQRHERFVLPQKPPENIA